MPDTYFCAARFEGNNILEVINYAYFFFFLHIITLVVGVKNSIIHNARVYRS